MKILFNSENKMLKYMLGYLAVLIIVYFTAAGVHLIYDYFSDHAKYHTLSRQASSYAKI